MNTEGRIYKKTLNSEQQTVQMACALAPHLRPQDLLVLSGGLGAGKTFFVRALCYAMGLNEEERVVSPTFALALSYPTQPPLVHADLYRLSEEDEVFELGLHASRLKGEILVVEWGAPFVSVLGGEAIYLDLQLDPREMTLRGTSSRAQTIIEALLLLDNNHSLNPAGEGVDASEDSSI